MMKTLKSDPSSLPPQRVLVAAVGLFLFFAFSPVIASAAAPTATTNAASNITTSSAKLNGSVNPGGFSTSAYFQYGTTTSYGSTTTTVTLTGSSTQAISATWSGLSPGTTYHYRAVAISTAGTAIGSDVSFSTTAAAPAISSISPNSGSTVGGNSVTIDGANLGFASSVTFGGTAASIAYNATTGKLQPIVPAHAAGAVNVTVTTPGGSTTSTNAYTYVASSPTISGITPNPLTYASTADTITINGSNFVSGCTVTLKDLTNGGTYPKSVTFVSSSQIRVTANFTNNTATWSAQVTAPTASNTAQFQVQAAAAAPTISSISPNSGMTAGGNSVTIDGANLGFASSVTFGGTAATIAYNATTGKLQPIVPAHAAGAVNVTVTTPGGSTTSTNGYTYLVSSPAIPTVQTLAATLPTATAITLNGQVLSDGGSSIVERRFEWAKSSGNWGTGIFGVDYGVVADSSITGPNSGFSALLSGLTANTSYKYRGYARNSAGFSDANAVNVATFSTSTGSTAYTLNIASSNPNSGVYIYVGPNDKQGVADGTTSFSRQFNSGTSVTLIAPTTAGANNFVRWTRNGVDYDVNRTTTVTMSAACTMTAVFAAAPPVTRTITVTSANPNSGVNMASNTLDNNTQAGGTTTFTRVFNQNATATYIAPATADGKSFQKWQRDGTDLTTSTTASVTLDTDHTITAVYGGTPALSITTTSLNPATAIVGVGYAAQQAVAASGGQAPYIWSASGLPNGMGINSSTGAVFGTPTVVGTFNPTITVQDSSNPRKMASKVLSLAVTAAQGAPDLIITSSVGVNPNPLTAGNSLTVSYTVKNKGIGGAAQSQTRIQVKPGSSTATTKELVHPTPALDAGGSITENVPVPIDSSVTAGNYTVYVILDHNNAIGQSDVSPASDIYQTATGALAIQAAVSLNGFVRDSRSNQPIANATVNLPGRSTITDSTGYYSFSGLAVGNRSLSISVAGYDPYSTTVNLATGLTSKDILLIPDLITSPTATLAGTVKDASTGMNIAQASVSINRSNGTSVAVTATDSSGHYSSQSFPSDSYTVSVSAAGYLAFNSTMPLAGSGTLNVGLTKNQATYGTKTNAPIGGDPVNTATGNYIYSHNDLMLPGPGLPFVFERNYNTQDGTNGPLGFGWNHSYNVRLSVDGVNNVTLQWGDSRTETYAPDGSGGFAPLPGFGIFDTLLRNSDGSYSLRKKNLTTYNFDLANRLVSIVDKNGNALALTYSGPNLDTVTDAAGRNIGFAYDGDNRITKITDPIARTIQFGYDAKGDLITATDANGNVTTYTYDANHEVLTVVDPRGSTVVTNTYDASKRVVTSQKDAKGGQTSYSYDEPNQKTTVTQALGRVSVNHYDTLRRLVQQDDALGHSTKYAYDAAGSRISVTNKNGYTVSYTYDASGNVTGKSDAFGTTTAITYDAINNPLSRTDAVGNVTSFEYDANGNLAKTTDPLGGVTAITYNLRGQPLAVVNANGNVTSSAYDTAGNLTFVTDALGNTTSYTYDAAGRRLTAKDPLNRLTSYVYDSNDNVLSVTDPAGNQAGSTYDGNNNRLTGKDRRENTTTFAYDVKDLLTTSTDPLGNVVANAYDVLDEKTQVTDARDGVTRFDYDTVGNLISVTDAVGQVTQFTYDANGNRSTATNPLGKITQFTYDLLDRLIQTTDPLGNTTRSEYDSLGRRIRTIDAKGRNTIFVYDALGHLTTVTDAAGGTVSYTYDAVGNRKSMTDPNGHVTNYTYDALNRIVQTTDPMGGVTRIAYDAVGNLVSRIDPNGNTTSYLYDDNNRRTKITYPTGTPVTLAYDANGNRTGMTDSLGTTICLYDALNRLTSVTDCYGKIAGYAYDRNGNRTSLTYPGNKAVAYVYDAMNRLKSVTDWLGKTTTYSYDAGGNQAGTVNPNGTAASYGYDASSRLTALTNSGPGAAIISSYAYTLDAVGNHTQVDQAEPLPTTPVVGQFGYTYDSDNRMATSEGQAQGFDANGNMISLSPVNLLSYDFENRLTQTAFSGAISSFQYDGAGNRMAATRDGVVARYVLDRNSSLTQVLAETDASGTATAYYVYGLGLISKIDPGGNAQYYHYDSRGSTIALTDAGGQITETYAYDPFGRPMNLYVSDNRFRYLGRHGVMDELGGFLYIRARYYSTRRGRFITKDPTTGTEGDSQSLNRYIYALNNPVRLIDISGLSALEASLKNNSNGASDSDRRHTLLLEIIENNNRLAAIEQKNINLDMWINIVTGVKDASKTALSLATGNWRGVISGLFAQTATLSRVSGWSETVTYSLETGGNIAELTNLKKGLGQGGLDAASALLSQASLAAQANQLSPRLVKSLSTGAAILDFGDAASGRGDGAELIEDSATIFSTPFDVFSIWKQ